MPNYRLNDLLDDIHVFSVDDYHIEEVNGGALAGLAGWYGVSTEEGTVAYFATEGAALFHRMSIINARLNGKALV